MKNFSIDQSGAKIDVAFAKNVNANQIGGTINNCQPQKSAELITANDDTENDDAEDKNLGIVSIAIGFIGRWF